MHKQNQSINQSINHIAFVDYSLFQDNILTLFICFTIFILKYMNMFGIVITSYVFQYFQKNIRIL